VLPLIGRSVMAYVFIVRHTGCFDCTIIFLVPEPLRRRPEWQVSADRNTFCVLARRRAYLCRCLPPCR